MGKKADKRAREAATKAAQAAMEGVKQYQPLVLDEDIVVLHLLFLKGHDLISVVFLVINERRVLCMQIILRQREVKRAGRVH